jgi:hypothetical protein
MSEKKPAVKLRVNIAGFAGKPVSLFAAYDPGTDILLVAREVEYEGGAREGFLKITNQARDDEHDAVFTEDETREAISAYFELDALKLLTLGDKVQRCNPANKIERDGMDERGTKYRIAPDINNSQVAVLVAAYYAGKQRGMRASQDFMDEMILMTI